jgi:hypothetical protein
MADLPTQLLVRASRETVDELIAQDLLVRRTSAALRFELEGDDKLKNLDNKHACASMAQLIISAGIAWPVSVEDLTAGLENAGIDTARAHELAARMGAHGFVRPAPDVPTATAAAEAIHMHLNGPNVPYVTVSCRPVDTPAQQPPLEPPVVADPHENPVAEGTYPIIHNAWPNQDVEVLS